MTFVGVHIALCTTLQRWKCTLFLPSLIYQTSHFQIEYFGVYKRVLSQRELAAISTDNTLKPILFFDFKDCNVKSGRVIDTAAETTTTATMTTTTTTTNTIVAKLQDDLAALMEQLNSQSDDAVTKDEFQQLLKALQTTETKLDTAEKKLAALDSSCNAKVAALEEKVAATDELLATTTNAVDGTLEQLLTSVGALTRIGNRMELGAYNTTKVDPLADTDGSDCDNGNGCSTPSVEANGNDMWLKASGGKLMVDTRDCGAVDFCDAVKRLDDATAALQQIAGNV